MKKLVLASKSPRRAEILEGLGLDFEVMETGAEEAMKGEPREVVKQNALAKARAAAENYGDATIIGADSIVVLGQEIIGKPKDKIHAVEILKKLSGKTHQVFTGVAVIDAKTKKEKVRVVETKVTFKRLTEKRILEYVATREPLGKAGAYALQGIGGTLIEKVVGSRTNVMGLPIEALKRILTL